MSGRPTLYAHPFSSYCWKVLIALWEKELAFDYARLDDAAHYAKWRGLAPFGRFPVLVDGERVIPEATIIIEHLDLGWPDAPRLIPADPAAAMEPRLLDRLSDNYLMTPMQAIVADIARNPTERDPWGVGKARTMLDTAYRWWDGHMAARDWAAGGFGLADCAAAPALFYADWVHPIPETLPHLRDYRARLLARPTIARAVEEARPFRHLFPGGAPNRD